MSEIFSTASSITLSPLGRGQGEGGRLPIKARHLTPAHFPKGRGSSSPVR